MTQSTDLVIPFTGEVVSLDDPSNCARVLGEIRELEAKLRELKGYLSHVLMEESKVQGSKTLHFSNHEVKINTPNETAWDYEILEELLAAGLPEERFNELVLIEQTYKINGAIAKSIAGSNEIYAEIIDRAQTKVPKPPSVSVKERKRAA